MAVGRKRTDGGRRVSLGTYTLHGARDGQVRLTISKRLNGFDFPCELGDEVRVDVIETEGGDDYLEVHPTGGGADE